MNFIKRIESVLYREFKRLRLRNRCVTIIGDNCNAGIILHDMRLKFNTPTVNLWFMPTDYLRFLSNLDFYLSLTPTEVKDDSVDYPVGMIGDVKVYFMHYDSFEHAKNKWVERCKRIDMDNLYVLMTETTLCTYQQLQMFNSMPFAHKCVFTHKPYPELKSSYYIRGFENDGEVGILSDWKPGFWKRRYLDDFDYISFLNQK